MRSIRNIILTDIVNNVDKTETLRKVEEFHADKMGAQKFKAHYAWYKGWLKKNPAERAKFEIAE